MSSVSVVIPTYNASRFIRETLASVLAQTRLPDEIIVVDDCSPDDTIALVEQIAQTAPMPVRVIRLDKNTGGPATPLNVGIAAAHGELIATLDHDDRMLRGKLESQLDCLRQIPDVGLVFGRFQVRMPDGSLLIENDFDPLLDSMPKDAIESRVYRIRGDIAYEWLHRTRNYATSCSNFLFRKSVWADVGGFDSLCRYACDFDLLQKISALYDIGFVDQRMFEWDRRADNLSVTTVRDLYFTEWIRLYSRFRLERVTPSSRSVATAEVRKRMLSELDGLSLLYRQQDHYWAAACSYVRTMWRFGPSFWRLYAVAKLPPHWVIRSLTGRVIGQRRDSV